MEIPKSAHNQFDKLKGSLADKSDFGDEESPFHDVGPAHREVRGGLEEPLVYALGLSKGGINIEVAGFHGKIHVEEQDYNMLEPTYDENPEQIEDVLPVQGEPLIVHKVVKIDVPLSGDKEISMHSDKKLHHHHTQHKVEEMEAFFKEWNTPPAHISSKTMFEVDKKILMVYVIEAGAKELENSVENNGPLVVMSFVQRANSFKPECKTHIGLANFASSKQIPNKNLITKSKMEVDSTCLKVLVTRKMFLKELLLLVVIKQTSVQPNFTSPMEIPQIAESDKTNLWPSLKEYPKADTNGKMKTFVNDSETKEESPTMIEIFSGIEVEPSLKGTPRTSHGNNRSIAPNDIPVEILKCFLCKRYFTVVVFKSSKASENLNNLGASSLVVDLKFTYVATYRNCRNQERSGDCCATDILNLEVEEREGGRVQKVYFSVVVKGAYNLEQEIYQIKLLGNVKLGGNLKNRLILQFLLVKKLFHH
ncbi:hypothetical protein GOBAR_AA24299 [Gossypium barbadense]|uniref:Uncharacterized protein n=1 Tax=Gossypium barbadense TaxID=3634 RepID=A0A2P5WZ74_GOSBA|nr:hypothetical protein GOBAR_AA24299 [Gossypium barbadense]